MDKLLVLYRYLNEEKDGYNGHKSAFAVMEIVLDLLQSLDKWGQHIADNSEISSSVPRAFEQQIVQACREMLIASAGDPLHAAEDFADQHLPLKDYKYLIAYLNKLRPQPDQEDILDGQF
jgi:hypothetical protein